MVMVMVMAIQCVITVMMMSTVHDDGDDCFIVQETSDPFLADPKSQRNKLEFLFSVVYSRGLRKLSQLGLSWIETWVTSNS